MGKGGGKGGGGGGDAAGIIQKGIDAVKEYTNKGIDATQYYNDLAFKQLQPEKAQNEAYLTSYNDQANGMLQPLSDAGYDFLDQYMDTFGIARPGAGSKAQAKALVQQAKMDQAQQMQQIAATQLANSMNMSPAQRAGFINSAGNATNQAGLMQGLSEFMDRNPNAVASPQFLDKGSKDALYPLGGPGSNPMNLFSQQMTQAIQQRNAAQYGANSGLTNLTANAQPQFQLVPVNK